MSLRLGQCLLGDTATPQEHNAFKFLIEKEVIKTPSKIKQLAHMNSTKRERKNPKTNKKTN
jgi:hypothetical protein